MKQLKATLFLAFICFMAPTFATTWNEPWQEKVIQNADYFVFAKIKSRNAKKGIKIEIIRVLGGQELKGKIQINDFYLLEYSSFSPGHVAEFHFEGIKECYFFIKKDSAGNYSIATPTSGYDYFENGNVYAAYRNSYHRALVPVDIYEKTMTAIFNYYHKQSYDDNFISNYVFKNISMTPAGHSKTELNKFFAQHVALECIYHLRLANFYGKIIPFLRDTSNHQNQISAARALISYNTTECKQELLNIIGDSSMDHFVQVICIWTLTEFKPTELKDQLIKIDANASTDKNGFGGNLMDPRVSTGFPIVKSALRQLIKTLPDSEQPIEGKKHTFSRDSNGKLVISGFDYNEEFHNNLASVRIDDKWGFVDTSGKIAIPLLFDLTNGFHDCLATVMKNGKWGYIDTTGKTVIDIQYDYVNDFSFGLAAVGKDDKYGYINQQGDYIILPTFDYARNFNFYITEVKLNDKWGYIDTSGKTVVPIIYSYAHEFKEGFGVVSLMSKGCENMPKSLVLQKIKCKERYGYADITGKVTMTKYDHAEDFKGGFSRVFLTPWWKLKWYHNINWRKVDKNFVEYDIAE